MSEGAENPKDAAGRAKLPLHLWPASATAYGAIGLLEGMSKYGRSNWRATEVAASVYMAAAMRHLNDWFEGQDDTEEGGPHLGNALACLAILVDATVQGTLIDDRNYTRDAGAHNHMVVELTRVATKLKDRFDDRKPKHWDKRDELEPEPVAAPTTLTMGRGSSANALLSDFVDAHKA